MFPKNRFVSTVMICKIIFGTMLRRGITRAGEGQDSQGRDQSNRTFPEQGNTSGCRSLGGNFPAIGEILQLSALLPNMSLHPRASRAEEEGIPNGRKEWTRLSAQQGIVMMRGWAILERVPHREGWRCCFRGCLRVRFRYAPRLQQWLRHQR